MSRFRPCIDLHDGRVKQIVGGSLKDDGSTPATNFVSDHPAEFYADLYRKDQLTGGHVIMLGKGNEEPARAALATWPGGLQLGGGINAENAPAWLAAGASHVIVTSWLFAADGSFLPERLAQLSSTTGPASLVIDLSCRRESAGGWRVFMNRWQTPTSLAVTHESLSQLAPFCAEFLIHAADVEGKCAGMDEELLAFLGQWHGRPITYAGGARSLDDLQRAHDLSHGRIDVTIGSALDIFGGSGVRYSDCLAWNQQHP